MRRIFLLITGALLFSGCGSAEKMTRIPDTAVAPNWFKTAEAKAEKLNTYLGYQAPADVKGKQVNIVHPDTSVKASGKVFIGDVAEIAYLGKVVNVYIRTAAQDAAKAYLNGISQQETPDRWYAEQAESRALAIAPKAAERLDSLSESGNATLDTLEENVRQLIISHALTPQNEIYLFGLLEKMKALSVTHTDMLTTASTEYFGAYNLFKTAKVSRENLGVIHAKGVKFLERASEESRKRRDRLQTLSEALAEQARSATPDRQDIYQSVSSAYATVSATYGKIAEDLVKKKTGFLP